MSTPTMTQRFVYFFGDGKAEAGGDLKHLVGGKGASLADMTRAGLNVPPGFTLSAECCALYYQADRTWPAGLEEQVRDNLARLEQLSGRTFGRGADPLLVAVRSGAAQSMPGMMDTVLNVGLNPDCVRAIGQRTGNPRGAWDAYRHFLIMFGHTVGGIDEEVFTSLHDGGKGLLQLDASEMEALCQKYLAAYRRETGRELPAEPWDLLREAINAVFGSWNNERAVTYRKHHRIEGLLGTAVNVQMMCPSEVSGVLFTANPVNPVLNQILIESSYGLGEAVVLGKVTPDRFVLDRNSLRVLERNLGAKDHVVATLWKDGGIPGADRAAASLSDEQLTDLARLGLRVEEYFKVPCDIEWAWAEGRFWLLQARPVKKGADREQVRQEEIAALRARASRAGTVWSRYNLAEVLPEPTPLTWAIVRRFMSGKGGFGLMYRDLGYDPDPSLDEEGIFDLVCGRPYCNLSREPLLQFRKLPMGHPFAALKAAPQKALYPQPTFDSSRADWRFWLFLPFRLGSAIGEMTRRQLRLREFSQTFARRFREEIAPAFVAETRQEMTQDLGRLDNAALLERLEHWTRRTLFDFARDSLKPTVLAATAMGSVQQQLQRLLGPEKAGDAVGQIVMGVHPDPEADLNAAVRDLAAGRLDEDEFLSRFGHRCSQEMELSRPRWYEDPVAVNQLVRESARAWERDTANTAPHAQPDPAQTWERIAADAKVPAALRPGLDADVKALHDYLGLRETAKHHMLRGYALIRRVLVELDHRHRLEGGIFFLLPEELPRLLKGEDLSGLIDERRRRRQAALSLEVPQVLFSDDLEAIGRPATVAGASTLQGVALSAGVAEGPALVLESPAGADIPPEPYVLVCPSTDPAWVPLFVHAKALVMETGGVLSHGAIAAREFGLPAVAGLPEVHRRLRTGQRLRVDGNAGTLTILP
jgi:phosphohistidine swiveling domain-containing protein